MPAPAPPPDQPLDPDRGAAAEERDFEAFAREQDPLDIEAATWVARRRNGLDARGEAELRAWLGADPRHAAAFDDMDATFGDLRQLPGDDVASLRAALPGPAHPTRPPAVAGVPTRARRPGLAGWLAGSLDGLLPRLPQAATALLVAAVVGGGWLGWSHERGQPLFEQAFATARGQQLSATLPDGDTGSTLQLDTDTRAAVRLYRDRREVHLQDGQALFAVRADAQRPFHVYAGALRVTVVGTRFSVRHTGTGLDAGQTVVAVEEGRVRVARVARADGTPGTEAVTDAAPGADGEALELAAGQRVVADAQGRLGAVADARAEAIAPWRDGRLSFDQTPLAQAIAEFERYGRTGLVVNDPRVAALPVGGSYSLGQWHRFKETLPQVLPVRLVQRGPVTEVVAR